VSTFSIADYLTSSELAKYLVANLLFLNFLAPNLPGVFEGNPLTTVNGALWTLKVEVMFYVSVPLIAWIAKRHGHALTLTSIYAASIAYAVVMKHFHATTGREFYEILARQLPGQLTYFVIGMALYHWRDKVPQMRTALFPSLLILWFVHDPILRLVAGPAALGLIVISIATAIPAMGNFGRFGDLSYGVYILHFPILQTLIALQLFPRTGWQGVCLATALVIPAAFLSWHLIEKRWLQKSSHYLTTAHGS
jgi:peptidoglycan/LPS O-acetylase OafA/YrhL